MAMNPYEILGVPEGASQDEVKIIGPIEIVEKMKSFLADSAQMYE